MSDTELVKGIKNGSVTCFNRLHDKYAEGLAAFITALIKDRNTALDVTQDIFMKLWLKRTSLSEDLSIRHYLFTAARNEVLDIFKSRRYKQEQPSEQIPDTRGENSVEMDSDYKALVGNLENAIEKMPSQRREVFIRSRYRGQNADEIAKEMQISKSTVKNHLTLALRDIRKELS